MCRIIFDSSFVPAGEVDNAAGNARPGSVPGVPGTGMGSFSRTDDSTDETEDGTGDDDLVLEDTGEPHPE